MLPSVKGTLSATVPEVTITGSEIIICNCTRHWIFTFLSKDHAFQTFQAEAHIIMCQGEAGVH